MAGDISNSNHTLAFAAGVSMQGEEYIFNGTTGLISAADHANWQFTGDFTIELFGVKFDANTARYTLVSHYETTSNQRGFLFQFGGDLGTKSLVGTFSNNGTATATVFSSAFTPTVGTAYALTMARSGTTVGFWVDGTDYGTGTHSGSLFNSTTSLRIGANNVASAGANFFAGRLKAIRINNGFARYTPGVGYTVPTLPLPTS